MAWIALEHQVHAVRLRRPHLEAQALGVVEQGEPCVELVERVAGVLQQLRPREQQAGAGVVLAGSQAGRQLLQREHLQQSQQPAHREPQQAKTAQLCSGWLWLCGDAGSGHRAIEAMNQLKNRIDELQQRVRSLDPLERRVTELEQRLEALEQKRSTRSARKAP